jgi:putative ABC transport system permease protein
MRRTATQRSGSAVPTLSSAVSSKPRMDWFADLRYGARLFRKSPLFTLIAVATLALGIGANAAIFSVVDAVIIRALPFADPDRLIVLWEDASFAGIPRNTPAPGNVAEWRRLNRTFEDIASTRGATASLTGDGEPEQVLGRRTTANFFSVLGVSPQRGRTYTEAEDRSGAPVVIISHGLWQRRFGGDRAIVGRTILMNDNRYEVIGVMPRSFVFRNREIDYWTPMNLSPAQAADRGSHFLNVVGRLKAGASLQAMRDDLQSVTRRMQELYPGSRGVPIVPLPIKEDMLGNIGTELIVLMAAAVAVLLIACANVASLLLSRAAGRRGELAVRATLGASRGRLVRQMVVEGLMLSIAGGLLGLALVPIGRELLASLMPMGLAAPGAQAVGVRLLGFMFSLAVATGLIFSLTPALQAGKHSLTDALHAQGRSAIGGGSRLTRDALVVLQVGAAVVLLAATGLMIRTLANLRSIEIGFRPERLLTMRTVLPSPKYADPVKRLAFFERAVAGVKALPGVERAAFAFSPPFTTQGNTTSFNIEGVANRPDRVNDAMFRSGTTDYLAMLDANVIEGRLIDDRDGAEAPRAVVINETLARTFFPNEPALGHRIQFSRNTNPFYTIVGVVRDIRERGYEASMKPAVYLSIAQAPEIWAIPDHLVLRTRGNPMDVAESVRRAVMSVDPAQPVTAMRSMEEIIDLEIADRHQNMMLLGVFAGLALVLATLGLYGLLAYAVAQRSREIGLRIALGATAREVVTMVALRGLALAAMGVALGIAGGWAATRAMTSVLYGVQPTDPSTFAAVVMLLGTIAFVACLVPAARAARVDPMVVLRQD